MHIAAAQWVFLRAYGGRRVLVAVNADGEPTRVGTIGGGLLTTGRCLFTGERVDLRAEGEGGGLSIPAYGARIIELDGAS